MDWGKKTLNDRSGFCPNLTFIDDEFKEDNKSLNDQGEGAFSVVDELRKPKYVQCKNTKVR